MKVAQPIVKVLGICGSLKKASVNRGALAAMQAQAARIGVDMTIADLSEIPFFNPDTEHAAPPAVRTLHQQMIEADAFVLATPEYNYSFTPALKNALDWGSRTPGMTAFKGKAAALLSVGGGLKGGRSQYHLRQVCVFLDLYVLNKPEILINAFDGSFEKDGTLKDPKWEERLLEQLQALKDLSLKLNPKPVEAEVGEL
eukprot:scaffold805_cov165-Amphora_coffeaeformis.AAC.3